MSKVQDLQLLKDINILYNNRIVLYGAGSCGIKACNLLEKIGISILGYCDSNIEKWGKLYQTYKILDFRELLQYSKEKNIIIIITIEDLDCVKQVLKVLERYGMSQILCYTYFALKHAIELHIDDFRIKGTFRTEFKVRKMIDLELLIINKKYRILSTFNSVLSTNSVLVFQPGKVASSTVVKSLNNVHIPNIHVHSLSGKWENLILDELVFSKGIETIARFHKKKKLKIISLVRDPISRGVSGYFQGFGEFIHMNTVHGRVFIQPNTYSGVNNLLEIGMQKGDYGASFEWFNLEIRDSFGVDVFEYEFDKEEGYSIIQEGFLEILLIKTEKLNSCEKVIGEFTKAQDFKLINENVGYYKPYCFLYEELKSTIEIPKHILDFYYKSNKAMDHFYTQEEKEQFRRKWERSTISCKE